jgi:glycosyltransferase involved in cell wall biosynthesis
MNNYPLVSVIIPTYNRAHLLPRAMNSVLNQAYQNFELIIVDDGSTDNTEEVVKSFDDNRIIYHKHENNRGVLATKNTGWDLAKGKYNCRLDDDDELLPEALETAVNKLMELSSQGIRMVQFDVINAESGRFGGSGIRKEGYISYEDILCGRVHGDYFKAFDMNLIGDNRFDERLLGSESILWLKLHRESKSYYVPKTLYRAYREHGLRISSPIYSFKNISRVTLTQKAYLEEYGEDMKLLCPRYYGERLTELGSSQLVLGEKLAGRKTLRESFRFNFSLKHRILYLLSFILNKNQLMALYIGYAKFRTIKQAAVSTLIVLRNMILRTKVS